jgi:predicted MFS family arabinose efflux permease
VTPIRRDRGMTRTTSSEKNACVHPIPRPRDGQLWLLRASCFCQIFAFGIQWSFSGVWMRDQGLGETLIGLVFSTSVLLWFFTGLLWGRVADRTGRAADIVRAGCVLQAVALIYLSQCRTPRDFFIYAALTGVSQPMITTLMPLLAVSVLGPANRGLRYASYRMFGSLGYIAANLGVPRLLDTTDALFRVGGGVLLLSLLPLLCWRSDTAPRHSPTRLREVLRSPRLSGFLISIFFFALAMPAVFTFTTVYARELGANRAFIGLLMAFQGIVALVALPLIGWGVDRFGPRLLLVAALVAMPLRALTLSFVTTHEMLLVPQLFHFFTWAGLEVSGVLFVVALAGDRGRATAQSLYMGAQVLGHLVGSSLVGYSAEHFGYVMMYRLSSAAAGVGLLVFLLMLYRERQLSRRAPGTYAGGD